MIEQRSCGLFFRVFLQIIFARPGADLHQSIRHNPCKHATPFARGGKPPKKLHFLNFWPEKSWLRPLFLIGCHPKGLLASTFLHCAETLERCMSVYDHLEFRHLKYILAIAEEGTFTAAAARLHVAQSALSRQIRELEDIVGVQIFEPGSSTLTSAGESLLRFAPQLLTMREELVNA